MPVRCFSCRELYDNYLDHDKHDHCEAGAYSVTLSKHDIRSLALDHAKHYGADETTQYLQERLRDAHSDAERNHLLDALGWVRRRHSEPQLVADGGMTAGTEPAKAVSMAERALKRFTDLEQENQELWDVVEDQQAEIERLSQRVRDLEDRDDLADTIADASRLKVEERAAHCIRTLVNQATQNGGRASMDYRGADTALGGGLDRRQLLDALERAAALADTPGIRFKKEERSSQRNSRLIVNIEDAELPSQLAGVEIGGGRGC